MKVALDTNILAYMEGVNDVERQRAAQNLIRRIGNPRVTLPIQSLAELFFVLVRKAKWSSVDAELSIATWMAGYDTVDTTRAVLTDAASLSARNGFQLFDGIILAAAAEANCSLLLSEDMHEGFTWRGCTIVNPFAKVHHPFLMAAIAASP